jgi:glycosyltransferase involved in cell wall biosynthesis
MASLPVPTLVSVIVPSYNAEAYLAETLVSALAQNWQPLELIVVDDGSTDGSVAVAAGFSDRVRVVACPHRGLAAARNAGIAAARGEFLLHLDADDLLARDAISIHMRHFASDPSLDMVTGRLQRFVGPERTALQSARHQLPSEPQQGHLPGATLIRASAFDRFGPINESFQVNADLDWSVRALDMGARLLRIDDVVVSRRIHGRNLTLTRACEIDRNRFRILRASLARRRQGEAACSEAK